MSEENIKRFNESVHSLYNTIMDKPLQVLGIFNDFFGEDKVDMQGVPSEDELRSWLKVIPISNYIYKDDLNITSSNWNTYSDNSIIELPQNEFELALSLLFCETTIATIVNNKFKNIFILVHFPHIRVTNEHDRFVDINHLWAKVKVSYNGTLNGGFTLNRSEYTLLHMSSNYMHSHISSIPRYDFTEFQNPCTGSGPINGTITALNRDYDEDMWNMFCLELSKYVTVESIAGIPYNYLESLGTCNMETGIDRFVTYLQPHYYGDTLSTDKLRDFVRHFINTKKLKFNYVNGSYSIGMSLPEYIILISNEFISWYNDLFNKGEVTNTFDNLKTRGLLRECIIDNGKIYYETGRANVNNYLGYIGKKVCTFKGREITISITDIAEVRNENKSIILNTQTALYILNIILKVLNYRYGRETDATEGNQLGTEVRYL